MDFTLSKEQRRILEKVHDFGERNFTLENIQRWKKEQSLPDTVIQEFLSYDFGFLELVTHSAPDHSNLYILCLILEELSRMAGAVLPFQADIFNLYVLSRMSDRSMLDSFKDDYARTGRLRFSFAASEPGAGSDSRAMTTAVKTVDGRLFLNGHKTFVNNGEFTPLIVVAAIDGDAKAKALGSPASISLWMVPCDLQGVKTYPIEKRGQRMLPFSDVVFENVEITENYRISVGSESFIDLFQVFEWGRVITCAAAAGMAQAAMDDAMAYAHKREAFGTHIAGFQQIALLLTEMETKIVNMRHHLYRAALSIDGNLPDSRLNAVLAKYYIPKASVEVASSAIQIFGGRGYTENERVYGIWEDCRGMQIMEGTDQVMVHIAGPLLKRKYFGVS